MSELTDYERERQERIAKNQELLQSLQIDKLAREPPAKAAESKPSRKKAVRPRVSRTDSEGTDGAGSAARPVRTTRSNAARTAALEYKDPEAAKRKREEDAAEEKRIEEAKRVAKHGDREIETWNPTGRELIPQATVHLRRYLEDLTTSGTWTRNSKLSAVKEETPSPKKATPRSARNRRAKKVEDDGDIAGLSNGHEEKEDEHSISLDSLRKTFNKLEMKSIKRVTPDRIYSLAVHPVEDKDLVFIGDRKGWLGMWNASIDEEEALKNEDDEEDEYDRHAFVHRVYNDHGTISCLRLDPHKAHTLYASSYDCTLRSLNFESGVWREEVDIDLNAAAEEGEGEALLSGFEIQRDGNVIWVSDNAGGATRADLREPKKAHQRWKIAESKAGCISLNPANENYFVTSHLNHDVRLWDARKLMKLDSKTTPYADAFENACVASFSHNRACSSAYFDPSGKYLVSTAYDSRCGLWKFDPNNMDNVDYGDWEPHVEVPHLNDTGAYVSVFKATWSSNPNVDPYFTIGSMDKALDIYSKEGKLIRQLNQGLQSVPAVTCGHPSKPVIFGGAAGGKVYYWKTDKWE